MVHGKNVIAVCARMGDPLFRPARARLIWAAQTAQALSDLGANSLLVGSGKTLSVKVEGPVGMQALRRMVSDVYNVKADFGLMPLYPPRAQKDDGENYGLAEAETLFPLYVLPHVDVVHTRDPRVVSKCIKSRVPVIFEDHNEDYQLGTAISAEELNDPMVLAVVAITQAVADRLVLMGVARTNIIVQDSGVNPRALERQPVRAAAWRNFFLEKGKYEKLVVYTGGMQAERGIAHTIDAAQRMPHAIFVMAGGNPNDVGGWIAEARQRGLTNVRFLGYLPQEQVIQLQQAADVVLMTRNSGSRNSITSPLKIFEYLASGTPVLSVPVTALQDAGRDGIAINWYDPARPETLVEKLVETFETHPRKADGYAANIERAGQYTWTERQKRIMRFAGLEMRAFTAGDAP